MYDSSEDKSTISIINDEENNNQSSDDMTIPTLRFPQKLWRIINDCKTNAISWSPRGHTVRINYKSFQEEYLSNDNGIFKTNNVSSFIRQLNLYGFRKITNQKDTDYFLLNNQLEQRDVHEFEHEHFREGRLDLLSKVCRKTGVKRNNNFLKLSSVKRKADMDDYDDAMVEEEENLSFKSASTTFVKKEIKEEEVDDSRSSEGSSRLQICQNALTEALEQATLQYQKEKFWFHFVNNNIFNQPQQPMSLKFDDNVEIMIHDVVSDSKGNVQILEGCTIDKFDVCQKKNQWQEIFKLSKEDIILPIALSFK